MREDEIRTLIRETVARRLQAAEPVGDLSWARPSGLHASHGRFRITSGGDEDGACLIEPSVSCTHCGYCQSYGH